MYIVYRGSTIRIFLCVFSLTYVNKYHKTISNLLNLIKFIHLKCTALYLLCILSIFRTLWVLWLSLTSLNPSGLQSHLKIFFGHQRGLFLDVGRKQTTNKNLKIFSSTKNTFPIIISILCTFTFHLGPIEGSRHTLWSSPSPMPSQEGSRHALWSSVLTLSNLTRGGTVPSEEPFYSCPKME